MRETIINVDAGIGLTVIIDSVIRFHTMDSSEAYRYCLQTDYGEPLEVWWPSPDWVMMMYGKPVTDPQEMTTYQPIWRALESLDASKRQEREVASE